MTRREILLLFAASLTPRPDCLAAPAPVFERSLMGTRFAITCHHPDQARVREATTAAFAAADEINAAASDYIADSELLSLTKHPPGTAVPVSPLLFGLLEQARLYAEKTGGLFDPTIGPFTKLWRESRRRKTLPTPDTLAKARAAVGWRHLVLDRKNSTATFALAGMRLDLGGIAKGQAADRMLEILTNYGVPASSITAGGDVRLGDPPPGERGWRIGIRTFDKLHDSGTLSLANCAVSTSGDLQQAIEIGGIRYAHIIDPATGLGLTRPVASTVIAPTAALSDALDAACCIAPREAAEKLVAGLGARLLPA